jgi:peptide deformylase
MTVQNIVMHPHGVLRRHSTAVEDFNPVLQTLTDDLCETLQQYGGLGLSAPQIGRSNRILVTHLDPHSAAPEVYINPEIVASAAPGVVQESCLSLPGVSGNVVRSTKLRVRASDVSGKPFERDLEGMHAVCLQHEIDHLNGVLLIDRMLSIKNLLLPLSLREKWRRKMQRPTDNSASHA